MQEVYGITSTPRSMFPAPTAASSSAAVPAPMPAEAYKSFLGGAAVAGPQPPRPVATEEVPPASMASHGKPSRNSPQQARELAAALAKAKAASTAALDAQDALRNTLQVTRQTQIV